MCIYIYAKTQNRVIYNEVTLVGCCCFCPSWCCYTYIYIYIYNYIYIDSHPAVDRIWTLEQATH